MIVTFCGHGDTIGSEPLRKWLRLTIAELIEQGANLFYHGGYGSFDRLSAVAVWEAKNTHPNITSILALPYLDRKVSAEYCDFTVYPELERVPRRFAISKRNEWMVDIADTVVAYVTHDWGGAATTLSYAQRKQKNILNYANTKAYHNENGSDALQILKLGLSPRAANSLMRTGAWTVGNIKKCSSF